MKTYIFNEPSVYGGCATIEMTENQIISFMKKVNEQRGISESRFTDEELIDEFIVVHHAHEKIVNFEKDRYDNCLNKMPNIYTILEDIDFEKEVELKYRYINAENAKQIFFSMIQKFYKFVLKDISKK